jgi:hypothetical protein
MAAIFSDITTPFINQITLKRLLVPRTKKNIFQNIVTRPEEAVTERFSSDTDASELQVIRVKPNDAQARELGADVNGAWFNGDEARQPNTAAYGIRIITTIDHNIDIPTNAQDMVNVDLAAAELENLAGKVSRNVNALTFASQLRKNFNDIAGNTALGVPAKPSNWVTLPATPAGADYLNAIIQAGAQLDDGNTDEGIDAYPDQNRAVFIRSTAKAQLLKTGAVIIGGSNAAQEILKRGGLDPETRPNNVTGYFGEIDNMPVYMASKAIWSLAELYLGLTPGALNGVNMLVVSGIGTGRALAFNNVMKQIDAPRGQGIRLQPKYRMGAECWDYLSVVPVVTNAFTNPATAAANLTVIAPASRTVVAA